MTQRILVPVDGSEHARQALEHACLVQRANGATIHLLHIPEAPLAKDALGVKVGATPLDYTPEKGREQAERWLQETWQECGNSDGQAEYHIADGRPAQEIVRAAKRLEADLIIMGSRGRSNLKGLAVGSVSHKVSHIAPCPVITLHVPS